MPRVFELNDDSCEKITFDTMRKLEDNRYFVPTMFKEDEGSISEPIIIQLNRNITNNALENEEGTASVLECILSNDMKDIINELDDCILARVKDQSHEWFPNKEFGENYFENAILYSVKTNKKDKKNKLSIKTTNNIKVYDSSHDALTYSDVTKDTNVNIIIQLYGVWFTQSRFGITWRLHQVKINTATKQTYDCLFQNEDELSDVENVFPDE
jgi:hypothetical protein